MKSPVIFDYMDSCLFLQDFYSYQKEMKNSFSYASWAESLGFSNKTLLRLIVLGKRNISANNIKAFTTTLNLNALEQEYFECMVDYTQAKNQRQKQALGAKLIQLQRKSFTPTLVPISSGVLSDTYCPLVLMAISSSDKPVTVDDLARLFSLQTQTLHPLLSSLENSNLILREGETYRANLNTFKIPDNFGQVDLKKFYKYWIERSIQAMELPIETRRFRSLQIALSKEEFESIVQNINDFAVTLLSRFEKNTLENRHIYMMNTALFPVSPVNISVSGAARW